MPVIERNVIPEMLRSTAEIVSVQARKPHAIRDAVRMRQLVNNNPEIACVFPGFSEYGAHGLKPLVRAARRIHASRANEEMYIIEQRHSFEDEPPLTSSARTLGVVTMNAASAPGIDETSGGVQVTAWLDKTARKKGYAAMVAPELASTIEPERPIWAAVRADDPSSFSLVRNIGMKLVGDWGGGLDGRVQVYSAAAKDVSAAAREYVTARYPDIEY